MKKCAYCGRENADDAVCCLECGTTEFATEVSPPTAAQWSAAQTRPKKGINASIARLLGLDIGARYIQLVSPLSPQECVARLAAEIDREHFPLFSWMDLSGSKLVIGNVSETTLRLRQRQVSRNSFQAVFVGRIQTDNGGSLISGEFGIDPAMRRFMTIWFWGVLIIGGPAFAATLGSILSGSRTFGDGTWIGLVIPAILVIWGIIFPRLGRRMAREQPSFITDFLARTLNASVRTK